MPKKGMPSLPALAAIITVLLMTLMNLEAASKPVRILFLGDSLTEGYGIGEDAAYPALVEKALAQQGYAIEAINAGSSGSTTSSAVSRLNWHLRAKPDLLVLALGANDGLRGIPLVEIRKNLEAAVTLAQTHQLPVLLVGMKLPPNYGAAYASGFFTLFDDVARKHKVPLVPFLLDRVAGETKLNLADGVHPNEKGHEIMAATLLPTLKSFLDKRS